MKNNSAYFAAFIMTYQRNHTLEETIRIVLEQTLPPQKVLIIDNDPAESAKSVAQKLSHLPVSYHAIGYNSGPAGAAKRGLEILAKEGFRWIGWIDDDDPPLFDDSFDVLIRRAESIESCGGIGAVGQRFDLQNAMVIRVRDEELEQEGAIEVDNIAGGMCKIVKGDVVRNSHVLPDESLFYGFEELDFDLRTKRAGYVLMADASLYKRNRVYHNRIGIKQKRGFKKPPERLWREYYSTRNCLMILKKHKSLTGILQFLIRSVFKSIAGFRFGFAYGSKQARFVLLGVFHYLSGKKGRAFF